MLQINFLFLFLVTHLYAVFTFLFKGNPVYRVRFDNYVKQIRRRRSCFVLFQFLFLILFRSPANGNCVEWVLIVLRYFCFLFTYSPPVVVVVFSVAALFFFFSFFARFCAPLKGARENRRTRWRDKPTRRQEKYKLYSTRRRRS